MQLQDKAILTAIQHFRGFVFQEIHLERRPEGQPSQVEIAVMTRGGIPVKVPAVSPAGAEL